MDNETSQFFFWCDESCSEILFILKIVFVFFFLASIIYIIHVLISRTTKYVLACMDAEITSFGETRIPYLISGILKLPRTITKTQLIKKRREFYRSSYLISFIVLNTMVVFMIILFISIYDIDLSVALYALIATAIFIGILGNAIYTPYLEGFKLLFQRRLQQGLRYDVIIDGKIVYENIKMVKIKAFFIVWEKINGKKFTMDNLKIRNYEIQLSSGTPINSLNDSK